MLDIVGNWWRASCVPAINIICQQKFRVNWVCVCVCVCCVLSLVHRETKGKWCCVNWTNEHILYIPKELEYYFNLCFAFSVHCSLLLDADVMMNMIWHGAFKTKTMKMMTIMRAIMRTVTQVIANCTFYNICERFHANFNVHFHPCTKFKSHRKTDWWQIRGPIDLQNHSKSQRFHKCQASQQCHRLFQNWNSSCIPCEVRTMTHTLSHEYWLCSRLIAHINKCWLCVPFVSSIRAISDRHFIVACMKWA